MNHISNMFAQPSMNVDPSSGSTLVTMFFDLKRLKDASPSTRPMDFYVQNSTTVLKLPYPMVIFCDEVTQPFLYAIRDAEVPETVAPTVYIVKRLEEYDYYVHAWPLIAANREERGHPHDQRNTASYFLMGMFKPLALWIAQQRNDFGTSHYAWIDVGCSHICRHIAEHAPAMMNRPHDKIACCYIHYRSREELQSMEEYMKHGGPCGIASTAYTLPSRLVGRYYAAMFQVFYEMLCRGTGHTDETVMTYVYDRYPELFSIYYGDYGSIFTNYHGPKEDVTNVVYLFIKSAEQKNRLDLAKTAARAVMAEIDHENSEFISYLRHVVQK